MVAKIAAKIDLIKYFRICFYCVFDCQALYHLFIQSIVRVLRLEFNNPDKFEVFEIAIIDFLALLIFLELQEVSR